MKVSYKWLKDYVDFDLSPQALGDVLTMLGLSLEGLDDQIKGKEKIVIGKIIAIEKHPDADRLRVCQVDIGTEVLQIITSATNVNEGDVIPLALNGAVLPDGTKIKKSKMRGVVSNGMMCSANELELDIESLPEEQQVGVMILSAELPLGEIALKALGYDDFVLDLELTSNRPDWLSMIGVAREIGAYANQPVKLPDLKVSEKGVPVEDLAKVTVHDTAGCPRYMARVIKNVEIKSSPDWLKQRLEAAGIRSINNIVDITNYVMLEWGQPLHAFDYDKIAGHEIHVRRAKAGEEIVTLDESTRPLTQEMLVIADNEKAIAVAGVMGGLYSEVTAETTHILLESANFNGTCVRRAAQKLGFRTESSNRFEKGLDPNVVDKALNRAAQLMVELGGGEVAVGSVDQYTSPVLPWHLTLEPQRVNRLLGTQFSSAQMVELLNRFQLETVEKDGVLEITVPTFRSDVLREADLVEEIARLYGYDKLPITLPQSSGAQGSLGKELTLAEKASALMRSYGFSEAMTYSFISPKDYDKLELPMGEVVRISNPLSEDQSVMRTTLISGILDGVARNVNRRNFDVKLFENAFVYLPEGSEDGLPHERRTLAAAITGHTGIADWHEKPCEVDFFDLKGTVETLLAAFGIKSISYCEKADHPVFHPGRTAEVWAGKQRLGILGEVHPQVLKNMGINQRVYLFELDMEAVISQVDLTIRYQALPKHPDMVRDMAIMVDDTVEAARIEHIICQTGGKLLEDVKLFDIYQGQQIPAGKKSMAYSLVYRSSEKTLTDDEVNKVHNKITRRLAHEFGAEMR